MKQSLRVLLESLVDYAGLFPPAALPMERAVANYQRYAGGEHAWMLGRFIVPVSRLAEVPEFIPVSVLAGPTDLGALPDFVDVVETKAASDAEISQIASAAGDRTVFIEISDIQWLEAIERAANETDANLAAKIRTGGVTLDTFPSADHVAKFMRGCAITGLPFKATAGLHHPVRCIKPLTYDAEAVRGTMHGFINVFMAAALVNDAEHILIEEDPAAFSFGDDVAAWRGKQVSTAHLQNVRSAFALSFGSCSFEEPLDDLAALGWM